MKTGPTHNFTLFDLDEKEAKVIVSSMIELSWLSFHIL